MNIPEAYKAVIDAAQASGLPPKTLIQCMIVGAISIARVSKMEPEDVLEVFIRALAVASNAPDQALQEVELAIRLQLVASHYTDKKEAAKGMIRHGLVIAFSHEVTSVEVAEWIHAMFTEVKEAAEEIKPS